MIVISDTSVVSGLIIIDEISILTQLFDEIIIPQAVKNELFDLKEYKNEVIAFFENKQIVVHKTDNTIFLNELLRILDKGEAEAISIAKKLTADLLLIDEKKGRLIAQQFGIKITGLLGLLLLAKQRNIISSVKQIIELLRSKAGFWIGNKLYDKVLEEANEK